MTTVGEILKSARERKKLTLAQVENATKIRAKFLEALENNEFDKLPPGTFAKGFVKSYASYLGLHVEDTVAFYRRQVLEKAPNVVPESRHAPRRRFSFTPQLFSPIAIGLLLVAFFGYLIFSYFQYAGSPHLSVNSPNNNTIAHSEKISIIGRTDPDATLTINNEAINLAEDGSFNTQVTLDPGLNTITIVATNKFHRSSTVTRNLRLEK